MKKEQAFLVGKISKTHGLDGSMGVVFEVEDPEAYLHGDAVFVEGKNGLAPYFIEELQFNGDRGILKLEEVDSIEAATALRGAALYIPAEDVPEPEEGTLRYADLIGFMVRTEAQGLLGEITDVFDFKSHVVLEMHYQGREVLVPLHDDLLREVDVEGKILLMDLPDGLLEVYL